MKRFQSILVAAFVLLAATVYLLPVSSASAQSSASLSIVPRKNYTIEPGKSVKDTITIRNLDTERPLELSLRVVDFTYSDDGGTPKLMIAEDAPQTTWSLKPYLKLPKNVVIEPKSSKSIDIGVSMPANHGAGSFYSAILYSSGSSEGGNVGLSASGVTLVFASVPGEVDQNLTLKNFGAYHVAKDGKPASYVYATMDIPYTIGFTLKNEGNVTESPVGSITLKHMFGEETVINDINPNKSLALIGQERTFAACIKLQSQDVNFNGSASQTKACAEPSLLPGLYTATLDMYYGQNGNNTKDLSSTAHFWYLPLWFIIISVIVLLLIAYFVWRIVSKVRGYSHRKAQPKRSTRRR